MSAYNSLIPQASSQISNLMSSPLNNSFFQNQLAQSQGAASQIGQRNISNVASNTRASGGLLSGAAGYNTASLNNAMLSNSANQSGAFNSSLNTALSNRNFGIQSAESFNPLQTGANTTQSKSGLGTWLPQVAGAALGAATGGVGGGLLGSVLGGGSGGGSTQTSPAQMAQYNATPWTPGSNTSNPLASTTNNSMGAQPWTS
jgi:hypothetical protein